VVKLTAVIIEKYPDYLHGEEFQSLSYRPLRFFTVCTKLSHCIRACAG